MEPFEDDRLVAALESLRPEPRPTFAAKLDERAAAGFPQDPTGRSPLRRFADRVRAVEPRRALIPATATALAIVAVATVVIAIGAGGKRGASDPLSTEGGGSAAPPTGMEAYPNVQFEADVAPTAEARKPSRRLGFEARPANSASAATEAPARETGPYAAQAPHREIERSAQIVLGTEPVGVRKAASEVFETVHAYRGIVLNSSIRDGGEGDAGARFALLIPSAKLGDAMADFSAIGEVRSRREATADITAPTVRTGELLRDSRATIEGLLAQLANADTDAERAAAEAQLRGERRRAAYLRSQLSDLQRRANLSRVQLRIESGAPAAPPGESDGWGFGDALGDAGHILAIAAGVTIVGLAIVGPLALIALLAWLANRARVKRARQRTLA